MSELAPYKKRIKYKQSNSFKEAFVTNIWGGAAHISPYIDLYCCEEISPPIETETMIVHPLEGKRVSDYECSLGNNGNTDADVEVECIIHARLKLNYETATRLRDLLDNMLNSDAYTSESTTSICLPDYYDEVTQDE